MPTSITDLLQRRSDLSTFLVHLSRAGAGRSARDNILSILQTRTIEARNVYGIGKKLAAIDANTKATQVVVCFTETPLEHVWMMCEDIENRPNGFEPYGVAVTKSWARASAVNPVWYLDITIGHDWLTGPVNELIEIAVSGEAVRPTPAGYPPEHLSAAESQIARLAPFIEQMGKPGNTRKEWWWEREWRHVGDLTVPWDELVAVFAPAEDHDAFRAELRRRFEAVARRPAFIDEMQLLDPRWGLERMIAALAGVPPSHAGPFPSP
jgi:hypothetical protein